MQAQNGATALHNAAGGGFDSVVKALLAANADIDVQNTNCNTALHLAAGKGLPAARLACISTRDERSYSSSWSILLKSACHVPCPLR